MSFPNNLLVRGVVGTYVTHTSILIRKSSYSDVAVTILVTHGRGRNEHTESQTFSTDSRKTATLINNFLDRVNVGDKLELSIGRLDGILYGCRYAR